MIRDKVQSKLAQAFNNKLADAVSSFSGTRLVSEGEYDPATGETAPDEVINYQGRGVFGDFSKEEWDDQHVLRTDEKLTVLQNELVKVVDGESVDPIEPEVGDKINGLRVQDVRRDPASVTWVLQLRKN